MSSSNEYESFFSYGVSRPFPFRWFTPGAVIGGIIFVSLFTFLNFASSGYDLIVQTSSDPNATISQGSWLQHWPSFLTTKVQPTCQPANLPVNSRFFTNQTALTYALTGVWQQHETSGERTISPSLTYSNNVLENCSITSIEVDLAALDRSGNQVAYSEWGAVLRSYVTCKISIATGVALLNLTQTYEYVPDTASFDDIYKFLGTGFLSRNQTTKASLWWGESLMSTYWGAVTWQMQKERKNKTSNNEYGIRKGTVSLTPNGTFSDLKHLQFFNTDYRFIVDKGRGSYDMVCCPHLQKPLSAESLNNANLYPNIWIKADTLAKSTYSTVLTDLGQTRAVPNMLTDPTLLSYFTSNFSKITMANFKSGPANASFDALRATTGPLGITPSVIATTYLCQVPRLKSAGNLILAILVADLVLLQVTWQLYKLIAEAYLTKRRSAANHSPGYMERSGGKPSGDSAVILRARSEGESEYYPLVHRPGYASSATTYPGQGGFSRG